MTTGLKLGRHMGLSPILARVAIDNYTTGVVDPFPWSSPDSTFDATNGGAVTGMLGNGPDATLPGFPGAGNCVFRGMQVTQMRNSWLAGETPVGDLTLWPSTIDNLLAYFLFQGAPSFDTWRTNNGNPPVVAATYVDYFTWCQENGYDNGCDVGVALLWATTNKIGNMPVIKRFAGVPTNGQFFQGGIGVFGVFFDALLVTNEMMDAAEQSPPQPWTGTQTDFIGGHAPPVIYRDADWAKYDTWDLVEEGSWPNWRVVREEGAVILDNEIAVAPDGTFHGVAIADLDSDIAALAKEFPVEEPEARRELILSTKDRAPSLGTLVAAAKLIVKDVTELATEGAEDAAKVLADAAAEGDLAAAVVAANDVEALAEQAEADAEDVIHDLEAGDKADPKEAPPVGGPTPSARPQPLGNATLREHLDHAVAHGVITQEKADEIREQLHGGYFNKDGQRIHDINDPVLIDDQGRPLGVPIG